MSWRSVIGWWIAAIVLLAVLVGWERFRPAAGAGGARAPRTVFTDPATGREGLPDMPAWPQGVVDTVTFDREGEPTLRFDREADGTWRQTEPVPYPIDPFSIERTIELTRSMRARDVLDAADVPAGGANGASDETGGEDRAVTPALLGFDPPQARLRIRVLEDGASERWITVELGRRGIGGRAYARVAGDDRILVIDAELHERAVTMDPREWRDRTIFGDVSVDTAASIRIQEGPRTTELVRDGRRWRMAEPFATRVNAMLLDDLIGRLATASVAGFVLDRPEDLARFGLAPRPVADVQVVVAAPGQPERTVRLRIGATAGGATQDRYGLIDDRPVVVRVPGSLIGAIGRRPAEWAEPTATGVRPVDVGRMRLLRTDPPIEIVLEREGAGWTMAVGRDGDDPGPPKPVAAATPTRLLELMAEVRAPSVQAGSLPADASTAVVLEDFAGLPLHTVRIAAGGTARRGDGEGEGEREAAANVTWLMDAGDGLLRLYPGGIAPPLSPSDFGPPAGDDA